MYFTVLWHLTFTPCSETTPILVIVNYVSLLVCMYTKLISCMDKIKCTSRVNCTLDSEIILNGMYACKLIAGKKNLWSSTLIIAVALYISNLTILTLYFSSIISIKGSLHKYGFIISFLGTSAGAMFSIFIPLFPAESIPWLDVSHGLVFVIWLLLIKHYTGMSWLNSFAAAFIGTLFYGIVSVLVTALVLGYLEIFANSL